MKKFLRVIRRNQVINAIVRKLLLTSRLFIDKAITFWPVSGEIEYAVQGVRIKLYTQADDALTSKLYYKKNWEEHILQWFAFFCNRSNFIVDAGANIGLFSLVASKVNPSAEIHAFEPNPNNIERLKTNILLNKSRISIQPFALAAEDGELVFYLPTDKRISDVSSVFGGHARSFNDFEHKGVSVKSVSLDSFFKDRKQKIDLLKIDVELYELYVLRGMRNILEKDKPVIFCEIFNDKIKRKQNPLINNEIPAGYTVMISDFLKSVNYHFYSVTHDGLIEVFDFTYSPMSSMYLLMPKKLSADHYLYSERESLVLQL